MAGPRVPDPMAGLLGPYPVALASAADRSAGRTLVATAAIPAGGLVLQSAPVWQRCARAVGAGPPTLRANPLCLWRQAGATAHRKHLPLLCLRCLRFAADLDVPLPVCCAGGCGAGYYCTPTCRDADALAHTPHCALLATTLRSKAYGKEAASHIRLLFRLLSSAAAVRQPLQAAGLPLAAVGAVGAAGAGSGGVGSGGWRAGASTAAGAAPVRAV